MWSRTYGGSAGRSSAAHGPVKGKFFFAVRTLPFLLQEDELPHLAHRGPVFGPVRGRACRTAAEGISKAGREELALAAADRAGILIEPGFFERGVGVAAIFAFDHFCVLLRCGGREIREGMME